MSAVLTRDPFLPRPPGGLRIGALLAVIVHLLLIVAFAFSINWHSSEPTGVSAELWSAVPQLAAPKPDAAPPVQAIPPTPVPVPVPPKPEPVPVPVPDRTPRLAPLPPRPLPDAQIAVERAASAAKAREQRDREERERQEERADKLRADAARKAALAKREEAKRQLEAQRAADEQSAKLEKAREAQKNRQDDARLAADRAANLRRMMNQAGTSDDASSTGTAARTSGPSASYAGRIKARIKPNIVLTGSVNGNPRATVLLRLAPDGTITARTLQTSSGDTAYDESVLRAIDKTGVLPRDVDGRVPSSMLIDFNPRE